MPLTLREPLTRRGPRNSSVMSSNPPVRPREYPEQTWLLEPEELALRQILSGASGQEISCRAQRIVRLQTGRIMGHELLSRGPAGSPLELPVPMFTAAERAGVLIDLDERCQDLLLRQARPLAEHGLFFVNMHPSTLLERAQLSSISLESLSALGLSPSQIVLEIAESYTIPDYSAFSRRLQGLRELGFQIAIDDFGAGYAGLNSLIRIRPQYLKIDRSIIANLATDAFSRDLLAKVAELARTTSIQVIAEGIECVEQLDRLLDLGIELGQGYLLGHPAPVAEALSGARQVVGVAHRRAVAPRSYVATAPQVGQLCDPAEVVDVRTPCKEIFARLQQTAISGVVVLDRTEPVGLVMRGPLLQKLSGRYGYSLYEHRSVAEVMERNPLVVPPTAPLLEVSALAMKRSAEHLYDLVIVAEEGRLHGVASVQRLMEATTSIQIHRATHLNPLSGLPGNRLIDEELRRLMLRGEPFSLIFVDLDHFKVYNDLYGFERGDDMIRRTAELLQAHFCGPGWEEALVGHVGGDDFVVLTTRLDVGAACEQLSAAFAQQSRGFFTNHHLELGLFPGVDRSGVSRHFPLTELTVVPMLVDPANYRTAEQVAAVAAHMKTRVRLQRTRGGDQPVLPLGPR